MGYVADGGLIKKSTMSIALAYDSLGQDSCIATACHGAGINAGISGGIVLGVATFNSVKGLPGSSQVVDFDIGLGAAVSAG
jgi:hypothetical protein